MARPSLTVTSSASAPARGTIRTDRTSPATRAGWRGTTWSIGVVWSRSQKAVSSWRSSSSTGFVSFSTNLRSATILPGSADPKIPPRDLALWSADAFPIPPSAPRCRAGVRRCHRRVLGQRFRLTAQGEGDHDDDHEGGDRPPHGWRSRRRERRRRCTHRRSDEAGRARREPEVRRRRGARTARGRRGRQRLRGTLRRRHRARPRPASTAPR